MKKNLVLLATCQGLMLSSTSLTMATSALVGIALAPNPAYSTLPLGLTYLCMMLTMIPGSMLMRQYGRRPGFALGGFAGFLGGIASAYAIYQESFVLFCLGSGLFGISNGFAQFYRFAAAEVVGEEYKSRAISWVLAGGLVAAFIGPNVARITRAWIPEAFFSASYGCLALFCLGVVFVQLFVKIPPPSNEEKSGHRRPLASVLFTPTFIVAALCAMIAYGTMNLLMTATPLAMDSRQMPFSDTAIIIQWHIVGMFAPSFFTGHLIHRYGVLLIMFIGALLLLGCAAVVLSGASYSHFFAALVLLGVGWNFLFVGGTTLLTEVYLPAEKGIVQGINDFLVFSATAFTALTSGYFHFVLGWERLNVFTIPVVIFAAIGIGFLAIVRRQQVGRVA